MWHLYELIRFSVLHTFRKVFHTCITLQFYLKCNAKMVLFQKKIVVSVTKKSKAIKNTLINEILYAEKRI